MNRVRVTSSTMTSVGYDPENRILEIEFRHSGIYQYFEVPPHVHSELMEASSHGKYFNTYIKNAGYQFRKIK